MPYGECSGDGAKEIIKSNELQEKVVCLLYNSWNLELNEYIRQGEPDKVEKSNAWKTAIGLQDVDGLKPSKYLIETAKDHIEGKISIFEADRLISSYYKERKDRDGVEKVYFIMPEE